MYMQSKITAINILIVCFTILLLSFSISGLVPRDPLSKSFFLIFWLVFLLHHIMDQSHLITDALLEDNNNNNNNNNNKLILLLLV